MLVVTRMEKERVRCDLGDGRFIWVTLVAIGKEKVRLGFEAPKDIQIWREEIIPFRDLPPEDS